MADWRMLSAIAAGGVIGALARYGLQEAFPHTPAHVPWATFGINVSGCLLIGVLMALITEVWTDRPLLRPFLGVGVLGGFTTFSAYVAEVQQALIVGAARTAVLYLAGTLVAAMLAVWTGTGLTEAAIRHRRRRAHARNERDAVLLDGQVGR